MLRVMYGGWMVGSTVYSPHVSCEPFHLRVLRLRAERYVSVSVLVSHSPLGALGVQYAAPSPPGCFTKKLSEARGNGIDRGPRSILVQYCTTQARASTNVPCTPVWDLLFTCTTGLWSVIA